MGTINAGSQLQFSVLFPSGDAIAGIKKVKAELASVGTLTRDVTTTTKAMTAATVADSRAKAADAAAEKNLAAARRNTIAASVQQARLDREQARLSEGLQRVKQAESRTLTGIARQRQAEMRLIDQGAASADRSAKAQERASARTLAAVNREVRAIQQGQEAETRALQTATRDAEREYDQRTKALNDNLNKQRKAIRDAMQEEKEQRKQSFISAAAQNGAGDAFLGVGKGIWDGLANAGQQAGKFETILNNVRANTGMTAEEMEGLRKATIKLGEDTGASFESIAKAYAHAHNFAFSLADQTKIVQAATKSAVSTGGDVEATTNLLAGLMHSYKLTGDQAEVTMNLLHRTSQQGNMTLEEFVEAAGPTIATASALGVSLRDVSAVFSTFTQNQFKASEAATQTRNILTHIITPTKQAQEEIVKLSRATGVDLVHDFSLAGLQAKGLNGIIEDVSKATKGHEDATLRLIGAQRGGIGMLVLSSKGLADLKRNYSETADIISGKLDPTTADFARQQETLEAKTNKANRELERIYIELAPSLLPILKSIAGGIKSAADAFNSLSPEAKSRWVAVAVAVASLATLAGGVLKTAAAINAVRLAFGGGAAAAGATGAGAAGAGAAGGVGSTAMSIGGTLLAGAAGGSVLALPFIGAGYGAYKISQQNDVSNDVAMRDNGLPGFQITTQVLSNLRDKKQSYAERIKYLRSPQRDRDLHHDNYASADWINNQQKSDKAEIARLTAETGDIDKTTARLEKVEATQRQQYAKARAAARSKNSLAGKAVAGASGGGKAEPEVGTPEWYAEMQAKEAKRQAAEDERERKKEAAAAKREEREEDKAAKEKREQAATIAERAAEAAKRSYEAELKFYQESAAALSPDKRAAVLKRLQDKRTTYLGAETIAKTRQAAVDGGTVDMGELAGLTQETGSAISEAKSKVAKEIADSAERYREEQEKTAKTEAEINAKSLAAQGQILNLQLDEVKDLAARKVLRDKILDNLIAQIEAERLATAADIQADEDALKAKQGGKLNDAQQAGFNARRRLNDRNSDVRMSEAQAASDRGVAEDTRGDQKQTADSLRQQSGKATDISEMIRLLTASQAAERAAAGPMSATEAQMMADRFTKEQNDAVADFQQKQGLSLLGKAALGGNANGEIGYAFQNLDQAHAYRKSTGDTAGISEEAKMLESIGDFAGSQIDKKTIVDRLKSLRGDADGQGDFGLVREIDTAIDHFQTAMKPAAQSWAQEAATQFGSQMGEIAQNSLRKWFTDVFTNQTHAGRDERGRRIGYGKMLALDARGQVEEAAGNSVSGLVSHSLGDVWNKYGKQAEGQLGKKLHDYIADGGAKAGVAIAEGAAAIYTAANALRAAFAPAKGQKRKYGGLLGTVLGGIAGSFLPGGWKAGSALGGQVGGMLGFAGGGRPPVSRSVMVGEHGPEIAQFDAPATIYSASQSRRMVNAGASSGAAGANGRDGGDGGRTVHMGGILYQHFGDVNTTRDREAQHKDLADHLNDYLLRT